MQLLITCEHGGNQIPVRWKWCFNGAAEALNSHKGYDPGALELAQEMAEHFKAPLIFSTTSRLVVELNRSLNHPKLFSPWTKRLSAEEKEEILHKEYFPYRSQVEKVISKNKPIFHLSIHSFTPLLDGVTREAEIGVLYDPGRKKEKHFAILWKKGLRQSLGAEIRVRSNYPYLGKADGFTTYLRKNWPDASYVGIELEVNQKLVDLPMWKKVKQGIISSLELFPL